MTEKKLYALTDAEAETLRALALESATTVSNYALDALTPVTVDEAMVERAARESYGPKMWDRLLLSRDTLASVQLSAHRAMTRAALDAALNTTEES